MHATSLLHGHTGTEPDTFLNALASLVLMIDTDTLIRRLEIDSSVLPQVSLKCHSKLNVTENERPLNYNFTQIGISYKIKCH